MKYFANAQGNTTQYHMEHSTDPHHTSTIERDTTGDLSGETHAAHNQGGNSHFDDSTLQGSPLYFQNFDAFPRDFLLPLEGMQFGEIFPFDDMELGQTLSSAAQWPSNTNLEYLHEQR